MYIHTEFSELNQVKVNCVNNLRVKSTKLLRIFYHIYWVYSLHQKYLIIFCNFSIFLMYIINFFEHHDSALYFFPNSILMFSFSHQNMHFNLTTFSQLANQDFGYVCCVIFSPFCIVRFTGAARPTSSLSFSMCKAATCNNNRDTKTAAAWVPHSALWTFSVPKSTLPISRLKMLIVYVVKKNCHEVVPQLQEHTSKQKWW